MQSPTQTEFSSHSFGICLVHIHPPAPRPTKKNLFKPYQAKHRRFPGGIKKTALQPAAAHPTMTYGPTMSSFGLPRHEAEFLSTSLLSTPSPSFAKSGDPLTVLEDHEPFPCCEETRLFLPTAPGNWGEEDAPSRPRLDFTVIRSTSAAIFFAYASRSSCLYSCEGGPRQAGLRAQGWEGTFRLLVATADERAGIFHHKTKQQNILLVREIDRERDVTYMAQRYTTRSRFVPEKYSQQTRKLPKTP